MATNQPNRTSLSHSDNLHSHLDHRIFYYGVCLGVFRNIRTVVLTSNVGNGTSCYDSRPSASHPLSVIPPGGHDLSGSEHAPHRARNCPDHLCTSTQLRTHAHDPQRRLL